MIHDNGVPGNPSSSGAGIWLDTVTGISVHHNTVWNSSASAIFLEKTLNCLAYNNLAYASAVDLYTAALSIAGGQGYNSSGNKIFNNTLKDGWWTLALGLEDANGIVSNNQFENNLAVNSTKYRQALWVDALSGNNGVYSWGNTWTSNSFGIPSSSFICYNGSCLDTYATFESAVGMTTRSVSGDPMFVNSAANNFNLQPGSPDIGAGSQISGFSSVYPNIGAY